MNGLPDATFYLGILISAFTLLNELFFFHSFFLFRSLKKHLYLLCFFFALFAVIGLSYIFSDYFIVKIILTLPVMFLFSYAIFDVSLSLSFLFTLISETILLSCDFLMLMLLQISCTIFQTDPSGFFPNAVFGILSQCLFFFINLIIYHHFKPIQALEYLSKKIWLLFFFLLLSTLVILIALFSTFGVSTGLYQAYTLLFAGAYLFFVDFLMLFLIQRTVQRERKLKEYEIVEANSIKLAETYHLLNEQLEYQRKRSHEFRNQIIAIESLLDTQEIGRAKEFINKITDSPDYGRNRINVGHPMANAILNAKYNDAEEKGILFILNANNLANIPFTDLDLVTILSNLLNNAIEACEHMSAEKRIYVTFLHNEDGVISLSVSNTYNKKLLSSPSQRADVKIRRNNHGNGVPNVIDTVKKYHGDIKIDTGAEYYLFSIVFPAHQR